MVGPAERRTNWGSRLPLAVDDASKGESGCVDCGVTPLHWTAIHGAVGVAKVLLENGADPSAGDEAGVTPARAGVESGVLAQNQVSDELFQLTTCYHGRF